ncbi:MAG: hypothetical protein LBV12_10865 [Puniceicoccales bacterium]|nr:hypothetical protein [Puniceicoccales bacterium]
MLTLGIRRWGDLRVTAAVRRKDHEIAHLRGMLSTAKWQLGKYYEKDIRADERHRMLARDGAAVGDAEDRDAHVPVVDPSVLTGNLYFDGLTFRGKANGFKRALEMAEREERRR